jgi:serine/threonine-protein kinase
VGESCGNPHLVESVLKQVCLALHELHTSELRIIHRDVKPANVLIGEDGHFKLSDLGFSVSLSQEEQRVTTTSWTSQGFSSPEQIANMADVDERADVFSLGALAFFMLTGSTYDLAWTGHSFISQTVIDERTTGWKFSQILPILLQVNRSHRPRKVGKVLRAMEVLGNRQTQSDDLSDTGAEICNCPECGCAAVRAWNWTQDEARGSCFCLICDYATEGG